MSKRARREENGGRLLSDVTIRDDGIAGLDAGLAENRCQLEPGHARRPCGKTLSRAA